MDLNTGVVDRADGDRQADALQQRKVQPAERVILDGENAALDEKGRSSFQLLQDFKSSGGVPLVYYAFDLLFLEGKDLCKQPLSARRKLLTGFLKRPPENIRFSDELRGTNDELLRVAQEFGLEGLVAKKPNSVYESGRRSGAWVKFKITKSQEFAIGGYTLPEGGRKYFGSLLVGYHAPKRAYVRRQSRNWLFRETSLLWCQA
jgi:bifunctional non-homologous end joining protein LigD